MNVLYKVYRLVVGIMLPVSVLGWEIYEWSQIEWEVKKLSVSLVVCLVLLPENCLAIVSIYRNKTKYEV